MADEQMRLAQYYLDKMEKPFSAPTRLKEAAVFVPKSIKQTDITYRQQSVCVLFYTVPRNFLCFRIQTFY